MHRPSRSVPRHRYIGLLRLSLCAVRYASSLQTGIGGVPSVLKYPHLWQSQGFIDGKFTPGRGSMGTFDVCSPATGQRLATLPRMDDTEVDAAVQAANRAWPKWRQTTAKERSKVLQKMHSLMELYRDDLATILTLEAGKPLAEAKGEINYAMSFLEIYAEEAKRVSGQTIQAPVKGRRLVTMKQPVGPCGLITPWNFPSAMITRKLGPALAAGCTVVIKPADLTPLSALALCAIAHEAGVPPGVVNCLSVAPEQVVAVGGAMCHSPLLRKLSFTGSTQVGKWLMRESASTVKRLSLELGGNAPFIVFDDADLDTAVTALVNCKFRNAGQMCISGNRIFVQAGIYDAFAASLIAKVQKMRVGNGMDEGVTIGPVINAAGLAKVARHVDDCVSKGAMVRVGGGVNERLNAQGGFFFNPTVLTGVTTAMLPSTDETFGPVAPLFRFTSEEEVIKLANDTPYGLAGYACTRDLGRAWRLAEQLECGLVGINDGAISSAEAPFGGMKESGLGREGGSWGIDEYLEVKYVCFGGIGGN